MDLCHGETQLPPTLGGPPSIYGKFMHGFEVGGTAVQLTRCNASFIQSRATPPSRFKIQMSSFITYAGVSFPHTASCCVFEMEKCFTHSYLSPHTLNRFSQANLCYLSFDGKASLQEGPCCRWYFFKGKAHAAARMCILSVNGCKQHSRGRCKEYTYYLQYTNVGMVSYYS